MNAILSWLVENSVAILWWLGQNALVVALLIPVALVACRLFRNRPAVQHAIWLVILVKFVTPPLVAWPWSIGHLPAQTWPTPTSVTDSAMYAPAGEYAVLPDGLPSPQIIQDVPTDASQLGVPQVIERTVEGDVTYTTMVTPGEFQIDWIATLTHNAVALWLVTGFAGLVWQLWRIFRQARLMRSSRIAPPHLDQEIANVAARLKIKPLPAVLVDGVPSPFVWCLGRIRLVWPAALASAENVIRSRGVIAHELAHLRRRDHWIAWLELCAGIVWWWNPLFWFVRRRLRETAEMACDALAIATNSASRQEYAELLLELSTGFKTRAPTPVLAVGAGNATTFERRLKMVLSDRVSGRLPWLAMAAVVGLALVILPYWSPGNPAPPTRPDDGAIAIAEGAPLPTGDDGDFVPEEKWGNVEIPGQVVDPAGQPVGGARIFLRDHRIQRPNLVGTADSRGKFMVQNKRQLGPRRDPDAPDRISRTYVYPSGQRVTITTPNSRHTDKEEIAYIKPSLIAVAPGFGFGTLSRGDGVTLKLAPDSPVTGRVMDESGKPLPGARIRVRDVFWPRRADDPLAVSFDRHHDRGRPAPAVPQGDGLDPWLGAVRRAANMNEYHKAKEYLVGLLERGILGDKPSVYAPLISAVTSDAQGRFTLPGIGSERVAEIYIDGLPGQASSLIVVATRPLDNPIRVASDTPAMKQVIRNADADLTIYGTQFETTLASGRTISGIVSDRATGVPLAGAKVIGPSLTRLEYPGFDRFFATTDDQGRFQIDGFPVGRSAQFVVDAPEKLPYFGRVVNLKLEPGAGPHQVDFSLARGVWVTGKVVDDATGQGIGRETVEYHAFNDNPYLRKDLDGGFAPHFGPDHHYEYTDQDGKFRIRGYPGRGIVTAGGGHDFLEGIGADQITGLKPDEVFESLYDTRGFSPYIRNTTIEVDIPEGAETIECELRLVKGKSREVHVVGPDGRPQNGIQASGLANQIENPIKEIKDSHFQVTNLFPGEKREVVARFVPEKLMGMAVITAEGDGPVILKLVPWASVTGRVVDEQGNPRSRGLTIELEDGKLPIHTLNGRNYDKEDFTIDADGRFDLEGLVPGATYRLQLFEGDFIELGDLTKDLVLKPGESRDLGDVKVLE